MLGSSVQLADWQMNRGMQSRWHRPAAALSVLLLFVAVVTLLIGFRKPQELHSQPTHHYWKPAKAVLNKPNHTHLASHCLNWEIDVGETTLYWLPAADTTTQRWVEGCPHPSQLTPSAWRLVTKEVTVDDEARCLCGEVDKSVWHILGEPVFRINTSVACAVGDGPYWNDEFNVRINVAPCIRDMLEQMMHDIGMVLDDLGVWWVAEGGIALGAFRHGSMLPYDYDGDLLVDKSLTVGKWRQAMQRLVEMGWEDYSFNDEWQKCNLGEPVRDEWRQKKNSSDTIPRWRDKGWAQLRVGKVGRVTDIITVKQGTRFGATCPADILKWHDSSPRCFRSSECPRRSDHPSYADPSRLITRRRLAFGPNRTVMMLPPGLLYQFFACQGFGPQEDWVTERECRGKSKDTWGCS
jgi:hypothetical protein